MAKTETRQNSVARARKKIRNYFASTGKEITLFFLALFYFVIATNTQTGWLFVLSAFLLGLLVISWALSRRSTENLRVQQAFFGEPQRNAAFRIRVDLLNEGKRTVQEVKLEFEQSDWAQPVAEALHWAIPRLQAEGRTHLEYKLTPLKRGEHSLPKITLICGAPFGLFTQTKMIESSDIFLVYPELQSLPNLRSRSRLATQLGELVSSKGRGDTNTMRSVRDYRSGDDLRQIHWKASAKRGTGNLLVREHHAHAPARSVIVLDTSSSPSDEPEEALFEKAVTLTSSLLWAGHREGTRNVLVLRDAEGNWQDLRQWNQQYRALAKVQANPDLSFEDWCRESEKYFAGSQNSVLRSSPNCLLSAWPKEKSSSPWPEWAQRVFALVIPDLKTQLAPHQSLLRLNAKEAGFQEVNSVV